MGVNLGIRSRAANCVWCQRAVGGIHFYKEVKMSWDSITWFIDLVNSKPRLESGISKCISCLNGSFLRVDNHPMWVTTLLYSAVVLSIRQSTGHTTVKLCGCVGARDRAGSRGSKRPRPRAVRRGVHLSAISNDHPTSGWFIVSQYVRAQVEHAWLRSSYIHCIRRSSDEWMIHSLPKARYPADGGRVPGLLRRIMQAATRFGSYRVESEGVLRGHEKPDYTARPDTLSAEQYLSKLFRGGVEKYTSRNMQTERQTWDGLLKAGVKTYVMAPMSPLINSPTFFCLHTYSL